MHYIKCDVNSSLLTKFWLLQKVCGTLVHCFIMTHSIHTGVIYKFTSVWFTNLLRCDIPLNKAPRTGPHHIWCIYTLHFLWPQEEHRWQRSWVDDFTGHSLLLRLSSWKTYFYSQPEVHW